MRRSTDTTNLVANRNQEGKITSQTEQMLLASYARSIEFI